MPSALHVIVEIVKSFVYLGSIFTSDGNCTQDIRKRLAMGRSAMQSLSSVWKSKDISTTTRSQTAKTFARSVAKFMGVKAGPFAAKKRNIILKLSKCGATEGY